jgi:thiosulfate/3-mercaptopyruvate sulfurtransferase
MLIPMNRSRRSWLAPPVLAFLISSLAFASHLSGAANSSPAAKSVRSEMLVTTEWLAANLGKPEVVVLHVAGSRSGYDEGHIRGARFVATKEIATEREGIPNEVPPLADLTALVQRLGIDESRRIVVYDEEAGLLAARAYVVLDSLGLGDRTALLDGHLRRWRAEARPTTAEGPAVIPSSYRPRPRLEIIVSLPAMADLAGGASESDPGRVAVVDSRPEAQYTGTEPGEGIFRPGHIPGAVSLFWMKSLVSKENPELRPVEELRDLFAKAGIDPGELVVTYCRTGMQASHSYFTARYLGHEARLYDGSFIEWSARKEMPVEPGAPGSQPR